MNNITITKIIDVVLLNDAGGWALNFTKTHGKCYAEYNSTWVDLDSYTAPVVSSSNRRLRIFATNPAVITQISYGGTLTILSTTMFPFYFYTGVLTLDLDSLYSYGSGYGAIDISRLISLTTIDLSYCGITSVVWPNPFNIQSFTLQNYTGTTLTFPASSTLTFIDISSSSTFLSLDMSNITSTIGNNTSFSNMSNLTSLTLPQAGSGKWFITNNTNLTGNIDLSTLNVNDPRIQNNGITSISINPSVSYSQFQVYDNSNLATINNVSSLKTNNASVLNVKDQSLSTTVFPFGTTCFCLGINISNNGMSLTTIYDNIKNIYDYKAVGSWRLTSNKTLNVSHSVITTKTLLAPTGFSLALGADGTVITPTNDAEREQAIREMCYILYTQVTTCTYSVADLTARAALTPSSSETCYVLSEDTIYTWNGSTWDTTSTGNGTRKYRWTSITL